MSNEAPAHILATAVLPWTEGYALDEPQFQRQVATIAQGLTRHIYILGTAGEGYALTEPLFDQVIRCFWTASQACQAIPMVGIISLSLPTIVARIERARAVGFRRFQLSLPSWGALNDPEVDQFFAETCGRFPDCEFNHYNLLRTKKLLNGDDFLRISSAHPNLKGVKSSANDPAVVADLLKAAGRIRFYFTEGGYTIARRTHEVGLLASLATANYARARAFVAGSDERRQADMAELRIMLDCLLTLAEEGKFHIDGAYDKMLYKLTDRSFPLRLLPPYRSATEEQFGRFVSALPPGWARA